MSKPNKLKYWNLVFIINDGHQEYLLNQYAKICNVVLKQIDDNMYSVDRFPKQVKEYYKFLNTLDVKEVFTELHLIDSPDKSLRWYVMI